MRGYEHIFKLRMLYILTVLKNNYTLNAKSEKQSLFKIINFVMKETKMLKGKKTKLLNFKYFIIACFGLFF